MMKRWLTYLLVTLLIFLIACESSKEISMTDSFKKNNRSSEINRRLLADYKIHLLGYRAIENRDIRSKVYDSTINYGIVAADYWIRTEDLEQEMLFGNDYITCTIRHKDFIKTGYRKKRSALDKIILKEPVNSSNETEANRIYLRISGTVSSRLLPDTVRFTFEEPAGPELTNGKLLIGSDSFYIRPLTENKKLAPNRLTGVELLKGPVVYAVVQCFPYNIYKRSMIFLYTKASDAEQFMIAAYFAIVGWYL